MIHLLDFPFQCLFNICAFQSWIRFLYSDSYSLRGEIFYVGLLHLNIIIVIFIPVGWRQERKVAGSPQVPFWCHVINYLKHIRHMHNMDFIPKGFLAAFISSKGHSRCDTSAIIFFVDLCGLSCSNYVIYVFIFIWISHLLWDYFANYFFQGR